MKKPRTIITTDMEVDDMNSLIHLCLYLNEIDLRGVIYTSSQYHFNGDGVHTLGEITPNYRCSGPAGLQRPRKIQGPDPQAADIMSFRPFPLGWIENLWKNEYAEAYPYLILHDSSFPSPEYLLSITKVGNIAFEGDTRFETEGSLLIKKEILSDDDEPLYLQSWGGANTIVMALLSIYGEYGGTKEWKQIYQKVVNKVRIFGINNYVGQDNSYLDTGINIIYPDLKLLRSEFLYGIYSFIPFVPEDLRYMFEAEWIRKNIHENNGSLMEAYRLMGDGKPIEGEAEVYQFGLNSTLDFGKPGIEPVHYEPYTFLGEGDSNTYIPLFSFGLRGLEDITHETLLGRIYPCDGSLPVTRRNNPYLQAYQEDFAARARWCCSSYIQANHAPVVQIMKPDITASEGDRILLEYSIDDPDGDRYDVIWRVYDEKGTEYENVIRDNVFVVPHGAEEYYSIVLQARDHMQWPMSGFGQIIVHMN